MDGSVTFEWFVRNRYFPLRQGDWRPETAKEKTAQIEIDLIRKFGAEAMESIDKFALQTHVNDLARRYSQDRVKQARSYLKSIFDEAIEQGFLVKDPTRKLKIPRNLRPKDKQVLTWDQLRDILATAARRDRLLLMLDMTEALRPSELFALRWISFDNKNTLSLTETVYRRKLRPFGKTYEESGQGPSARWARRRSSTVETGVPRSIPESVHVSERRRRSTGPGELSQSGSEASRRGSGFSQADFPGAPPYDGDPGTESGIGEGHPGTPPALARGYHRERVHAGTP